MAGYDEQEKQVRKKLDAVQSSKEYESLNKELLKVKKSQADLEPAILQAWKEAEHAEQAMHKVAADTAVQIQTLTATFEQGAAKIVELENAAHLLREQRGAKVQGIQPDMLAQYEKLYNQVSNPIVPLVNNTCSACFYSVTNKDIIEMRKRKLVQCNDCFRLLFLPEAIQIQV